MKSNNKHIVWLDIDTTGLDRNNDRIIQIGLIKTDQDGNVIDAVESKINPCGVKSSAEAFAKHQIKDEELLTSPTFADVADKIIEFTEGCDLGGHNVIKFDIPFLMCEFKKCGKMFSIENRAIYDTKVMYNNYNQMHLKEMHNQYCPDSELENNAHDAIFDAKMTLELFVAMKRKHNIGKDEIDAVNGNDKRIDMEGFFICNENNEVVVGKGKYKGKKIEDVDPSFFQWLSHSDVLPETQALAVRCYNYLMKKQQQ